LCRNTALVALGAAGDGIHAGASKAVSGELGEGGSENPAARTIRITGGGSRRFAILAHDFAERSNRLVTMEQS
jgi:hypothetical protein